MVIAATNISGTVSNMFALFYHSLGNTVAILAGQALGANDTRRAKDIVAKMLFFALCLCVVIGLVLGLCSPLLPRLYNTGEEVRALASKFIVIIALMTPANGITNWSYFILRCGGKALITFIFDCFFFVASAAASGLCAGAFHLSPYRRGLFPVPDCRRAEGPVRACAGQKKMYGSTTSSAQVPPPPPELPYQKVCK